MTHELPRVADQVRAAAAAVLISGKSCAFVVAVPQPGRDPLVLSRLQTDGGLDDAARLAIRAAAGGRSLLRSYVVATCRPETIKETMAACDAAVHEISESAACHSQIVVPRPEDET